MTSEQLYLAIGIPILFNGLLLLILFQSLSNRIGSGETRIGSLETALNKRIDDLWGAMDKRFDDLHAFLRIVMGKQEELDARVAKLEGRR